MTPFTQQDKDAWISRLESADSEQLFGEFGPLGKSTGPHCALGWCAVDEEPHIAAHKIMSIDSDVRLEITMMNDDARMSLPEIAVWVKENVEVTA